MRDYLHVQVGIAEGADEEQFRKFCGQRAVQSWVDQRVLLVLRQTLLDMPSQARAPQRTPTGAPRPEVMLHVVVIGFGPC